MLCKGLAIDHNCFLRWLLLELVDIATGLLDACCPSRGLFHQLVMVLLMLMLVATLVIYFILAIKLRFALISHAVIPVAHRCLVRRPTLCLAMIWGQIRLLLSFLVSLLLWPCGVWMLDPLASLLKKREHLLLLVKPLWHVLCGHNGRLGVHMEFRRVILTLLGRVASKGVEIWVGKILADELLPRELALLIIE